MKQRYLLSILLFALASPAFCQTWFTVGSEGDTLTLPVGAVVRYGDLVNNKWDPPLTITVATTTLVASNATIPGGDPDSGTVKILQVQEQAAAFSVTDAAAGVATKKLVPALAAPSYPPVTVTPGTVYKLVYSNVAVIQGAPAAQIIAAVNLPPYDLMAAVLQNLTVHFTFQGIVYDCTFGAVSSDGTVIQNCIPEPVPGS